MSPATAAPTSPATEPSPVSSVRASPARASPASDPDRLLAVDAVSVVQRLARDRRPSRWSAPAFRREVDLVRSHLGPLRDRSSLAHSFVREAFHTVPGSVAAVDRSAVRVAYALRWLELGDGGVLPSWSQLLDAPTIHPLVAALPS